MAEVEDIGVEREKIGATAMIIDGNSMQSHLVDREKKDRPLCEIRHTKRRLIIINIAVSGMVFEACRNSNFACQYALGWMDQGFSRLPATWNVLAEGAPDLRSGSDESRSRTDVRGRTSRHATPAVIACGQMVRARSIDSRGLCSVVKGKEQERRDEAVGFRQETRHNTHVPSQLEFQPPPSERLAVPRAAVTIWREQTVTQGNMHSANKCTSVA